MSVYGVRAESLSANGFDRLAPHYYWMECLLAGRALQKCRTTFLDETRDASRALLIGEGNGRFLTEFLKANRKAAVLCVDSSCRMLGLARRTAAREEAVDRVQFVQADLLAVSDSSWQLGSFDLVVTHFFLDCFRAEQLDRIIGRIAEQTSSRATWLLADFRVPAAPFARIRAKAILWLAYTFFRTLTRLPAKRITPPDCFLEKHGFILEKRIIREHGLLHSDLWRGSRLRGSGSMPHVQTAESVSSSGFSESTAFG